jgi:integrase
MSRQLTPGEAVERYIRERKSDLSDSTIYNYKSNLGIFVEWCEYQSDIEYVSDIDQFHISDYRTFKRDDENVANTTLYNVLMSLRTFLKWCEGKGLTEGLSESIVLPDKGAGTRSEVLDAEVIEQVLEQLEKYHYATYYHVAFALMWDCGLRIGAVRAIDLDDYHSDEAYIELQHRPGPGNVETLSKDRGTPLKNGEESERELNLHPWAVSLVDDYLNENRQDVTDDFGREPLLTTNYGRPARTTLRRHITAVTRPCFYSNECPVDRTIETCKANGWEEANQCPETVKPHSIRRSSITAWLDDGHSKELVSDRMDVSTDVLDEHYDQRTEEQKRKLRKELFEM